MYITPIVQEDEIQCQPLLRFWRLMRHVQCKPLKRIYNDR